MILFNSCRIGNTTCTFCLLLPNHVLIKDQTPIIFFFGWSASIFPSNELRTYHVIKNILGLNFCQLTQSTSLFWMNNKTINELDMNSTFVSSEQLWTSRRVLSIFLQMKRKANSIIINYWTRLSKISWFVCGEQINYLPKAEANNWSARHWQITIFCDNRVQ